MFGRNLISFVSTLVLLISLNACSSGKKDTADQAPVVTPTPTVQSIITPPALTCSAALNKSVAAAEELLTLTVTASGGSGNYSIPGFVNSFAQSTAIYGSYHNNTSATINYTKTVTVRDAVGASASCSFSVAVTPYNGGSGGGGVGTNGLACQINVAANPQPGVATQFTIIGAGAGSGATYTFSQFSPDLGVYIATTPVSSNANSSTVSASYTYPIAKYTTASISVTAGGVTVPCSLPLTVSSPDLLVAGATSATVGSNIYLHLTASGFGFSTFKYFAAQSAATFIQMNLTQNNAAGTADLVISATDSLAHEAFNVDVSVNTQNGAIVTKHLTLSFSQPLNCTLSQLDIPTRTNTATRFQMTASTGEALQITELVATPDVTNVSGLNVNPIQLKFPRAGYYHFSVKAKSTTRNVYCNNSNYIGYTAEVRTGLTGCSVVANVNPAIVNSSVGFSAVLPDNAGTGPFTINLTTVSSVAGGGSVDIAPASGLSKTIAFTLPGYYQVNMSVRDNSDGTTVNCSTWETVNPPAAGLRTTLYDIPWGNNSFSVFSGFENTASPYSSFSSPYINVHDTLWYHGFPGLPSNIAKKEQYFALSYQGRIYIQQTGTYYFQLRSDDGAALYIDNDVKIDDDGIHAPRNKNSGGVYLTQGYHTIKVNYFQGPLALFAIQLKWRPPFHGDMDYHVVPASVLFAP